VCGDQCKFVKRIIAKCESLWWHFGELIDKGQKDHIC